MAAPALFADVLDSKTHGAMPGPRRMGLWAPQSVWLYALPVVDLNRISPSTDRVSVAFGDGGSHTTNPNERIGPAAEREAERRADDSGPEPSDVGVPRPPRELSAAAKAALTILRGLGARSLDERFTPVELKRAFRVLAKRLHPDRHPDASSAERARLARDFGTMTEAVALLLASV